MIVRYPVTLMVLAACSGTTSPSPSMPSSTTTARVDPPQDAAAVVIDAAPPPVPVDAAVSWLDEDSGQDTEEPWKRTHAKLVMRRVSGFLDEDVVRHHIGRMREKIYQCIEDNFSGEYYGSGYAIFTIGDTGVPRDIQVSTHPGGTFTIANCLKTTLTAATGPNAFPSGGVTDVEFALEIY